MKCPSPATTNANMPSSRWTQSTPSSSNRWTITIADDCRRTIFTKQRLPSARQIDDRQAPVRQHGRRGDHRVAAVRSAVP
jgi:hypothetical protein